MGQHIHDQSNVVIDLGGRSISGYVDGGGGRSILLLERCTGVTIQHVRFDGQGSVLPWYEHAHCIRLLNCRDVNLLDLHGDDVMGDGLYVSHDLPFARGVGIEGRGSENIYGQHLEFKGASVGRNGISIICGRHILLEDIYIENVTKIDMPGPIDFEPDWPQEYIEDVTVRRANFNTGRSIMGIGVHNAVAHTPRISGITWEDVSVHGPVEAAFYADAGGQSLLPIALVRPLAFGADAALLERNAGKFAVTGGNVGGDSGGGENAARQCKKRCHGDHAKQCRKRCERDSKR